MKKIRFRQGLAVAVALFMTINYAGSYLGRSPVVSMADTAATVSATSLNVRGGPGTASSIVGKLTYGAAVSVAGETRDSEGNVWYQIYFTKNGAQVSGYVRSDYIKFPTAYESDADFERYMTNQGFPESYKPGLRQIHAEYPNWVFTAQYTNLDWNDVIDNESVVGRNLVPGSSPSSWKSTESGAYNWETGTWPSFDSGSWVAASRTVISYYMDPRNFLNEKYVFQFLRHNYNSSIHTIDGIKNMVQGTFLDDTVDVSKSQPSSGTGAGSPEENPGGTQTAETTAAVPGTTGPGAVGPGAPQEGNSGSTGGSSGSGSGNGGPGQAGGSGNNDVTVQPGVSPGGGGQAQESQAGSSGTTGDGNNVQAGAGPGTGSGEGAYGEAPNGGGNSDVSLQAPGASVSRNRTYRVGTAIGPGVPAGPGESAPASGDTYSAPIASYAEIIMNAAAQSGVNPYVLTAMILQEQGSQGSRGVSGTVAGYEGYYNFFNIEAYKSGSMEAIERGLWYASQQGSYERPWNSVDKAILGGAVYYGTNYVNAGQDTFYLKKFNVQGENLYKHQYMTNVQAAASEGAKLEEAYSSQLKQLALEFKIPVFKNMPESPCALPDQDGSPNNKLSSLSVDGYTLTPTFNREITVYNLVVDPSVTVINVRAAALDSGAVITGIGNIRLEGDSQDIVIEVKAPNGASCPYVIHVARQGSGSTVQPGAAPSGPGQTGPGVTQSPAETSAGGSIEIITDGPGQSGAEQEGGHTGPGGSNVTIVQ